MYLFFVSLHALLCQFRNGANYIYPTSPGPQPNSAVCILLFYMTGLRIRKFVPSDSFQVKRLKTVHVLSPIKEDPECCHNNIIQTCNGNQSLSMKMDSIGRTNYNQ